MVIFVYIIGYFRRFQLIIFSCALIYHYRKSDTFSSYHQEQKNELDEADLPPQEQT